MAPRSNSGQAGRLLWGSLGVALLGLLGLALVVLPQVANGTMPGDVADSRFNNYILEHGYLWAAGRLPSFWNARFFYPFPLVTAISDSNLGAGFAYWGLRWLGLDRYDAYRGWYLLGYAVNFAAAAYALRRLDHGWMATGLGAFLFAFAMPVTAQDSVHSQLDYRFGVPLAVLALVRFERAPKLGQLSAITVWTVWQFYCSIYLGFFQGMLLAAFALAYAGRQRGLAMLTFWPARGVAAWRSASGRARVVFLITALASALLLLGLLRPYMAVNRLYGFRREWVEIASMLPRPASYLLADQSMLWRFSWSGFDALLNRQEHQMFIGAAPFLAVAAALVLVRCRRAGLAAHFRPAAVATGILVLLTLSIEGWTLYGIVAGPFGVTLIRTVSRIILVLVFPAAMLVAGAIDAIAAARLARPGVAVLLVPIAGLLILECMAVRPYTTRESLWRNRVDAVVAALPKTLPDAPILLIGPLPGEYPLYREIDAMVVAQERGWPTLNGASANTPPGHAVTGDCRDVSSSLSGALDLLGDRRQETFDALARRIVLVDYAPCGPSWQARRVPVTRFAGAFPPDHMADIAVSIEQVELRAGGPVLRLLLENHGDLPLPAASSTGMPIQIAARYIAADAVTPEALRGARWSFRQNLDTDVPPGGSLRVTMPLTLLPPIGGPYAVAASLRQVDGAWFDDHGMPIALSAQGIGRDDALHLVDLGDGPGHARP
jgi:hypothetical protein